MMTSGDVIVSDLMTSYCVTCASSGDGGCCPRQLLSAHWLCERPLPVGAASETRL
jgi:hypothetical protein